MHAGFSSRSWRLAGRNSASVFRHYACSSQIRNRIARAQYAAIGCAL
jgi:hypothetical protein